MRKLFSTLRIVYCLFMARTFGQYHHSIGGPNQPDFAVYNWREQDWWVPTGSTEQDYA
jgi:hypothetical protein